MTWLALGYIAVGYYYFRMVLRSITAWDSIDTILLNAALALTIGPLLLVPAIIYKWFDKAMKYVSTKPGVSHLVCEYHPCGAKTNRIKSTKGGEPRKPRVPSSASQ